MSYRPEYAREYSRRNRARINARRRERRRLAGGTLPYDRVWKAKNRDKVIGYGRKYRQLNLEKCRAMTRAYMKTHPASAETVAKHRVWKRDVWYKRNRDRVRQQATNRAESIRQVIRAAKECPCTDCGKSYPYYVMDFDHVRGEKKYTIGRILNGPSLIKLAEEINKCDVVCSNCHRERTHKRRSKIIS